MFVFHNKCKSEKREKKTGRQFASLLPASVVTLTQVCSSTRSTTSFPSITWMLAVSTTSHPWRSPTLLKASSSMSLKIRGSSGCQHCCKDTQSFLRRNTNSIISCWIQKTLQNVLPSHVRHEAFLTNGGCSNIFFKAKVSLSLIGWEKIAITIVIKGVIWFGLVWLISSLFADKFGCPWYR